MTPAPQPKSQSATSANIQTFVINLDRSTHRLAAMRNRLGRLNMAWQRVAAVDGHTLDLAGNHAVSPRDYQRCHGKDLNPAEVGCYLSHLACLRLFLAGPAQHALILEDDADFPADFEPLLDHLLAIHDRWDIVKLSGFHSGTPVRIAKLNAPYALAVPLSRHMNANSILFSRRAAETLLAQMLPMFLPYDHALERAWLFGLKLRIVTPSPCPSETDLLTTIGDRPHLKRFKFPLHKRLPAMLFRLRTEAMRLAFGLIHLYAARRIGNRVASNFFSAKPHKQ